LQCLILGLALTDAAIVAERTDVVWAMPQTASFYATLGLPVNLRGLHFTRVAATAERHDGEPILIVQGEIGNGTTQSAEVPPFALCDPQCGASGNLLLDRRAGARTLIRRPQIDIPQRAYSAAARHARRRSPVHRSRKYFLIGLADSTWHAQLSPDVA